MCLPPPNGRVGGRVHCHDSKCIGFPNCFHRLDYCRGCGLYDARSVHVDWSDRTLCCSGHKSKDEFSRTVRDTPVIVFHDRGVL